MGLVVLIGFVAVCVLELWVFVQVANAIGFGWALLAAIAISVGGVWLIKRQGLTTARRMRERVGRGEVPDREMADAFLLFIAGVLLLFPGFVTGVVGLLLLLPPVRALLRPRLRAGARRNTIVATYRHGDVLDTSSTDEGPPPSPPRGELEP